MKRLGTKIYWFLLPAALLVILDEFVKAFALTGFPDEKSLTDRDLINFAVHKNWGLAFDIPFRRELILIISIVIGYFLVRIAYKNIIRHPDLSFASLLILAGALGNVFDRIVYGFTVDYLIFFSRSALNISDLLIIYGVILLLLASRRPKNHGEIHPDEPNEI